MTRKKSRYGSYAFAWVTVALLGASPSVAATVEQKQFAETTIDRNAEAMTTIGDSLFQFGELGMQETESVAFMKSTLEKSGFTVELGGAGMPTNLWAHWGLGHPVIAIVTEIDALPGGNQTPGVFDRKPQVPGAPGHMEGHNTHGALSAGAAVAVKQAMQRFNIPGTIVISLGPAEEQLISRPYLVRAGFFKDVDAVIYAHINETFGTGFGLSTYAAVSADFTFHGKTAHGAINPWDGKNALDAVELMDNGIAFLRQQLRPTNRAHRVITNGGIQPNVIPDLAQAWWFVRDTTMPYAKETLDKMLNIAKGAALMTGTTVDTRILAAAWPQLGNKTLAAAIQANIERVGMPAWTEEEQKFARDFQQSAGRQVVGLPTAVVPFGGSAQSYASNDSGDVSWTVPAGIFYFPASVPGIAYHEWHAAVTPTSSIAHKGTVAGAKALADTMLDLLTEPAIVQKAQAEFKETVAATPYFAVLPDDAKPPLTLNHDMMERYRPAMKQFYVNKEPPKLD